MNESMSPAELSGIARAKCDVARIQGTLRSGVATDTYFDKYRFEALCLK